MTFTTIMKSLQSKSECEVNAHFSVGRDDDDTIIICTSCCLLCFLLLTLIYRHRWRGSPREVPPLALAVVRHHLRLRLLQHLPHDLHIFIPASLNVVVKLQQPRTYTRNGIISLLGNKPISYHNKGKLEALCQPNQFEAFWDDPKINSCELDPKCNMQSTV